MDQQKKALYDRQLYVLGEHAMHRMAGTNVLIVGLGGLGVEVAKNVILTGVGSVTLYDPKPVSWSDLSAQFYFAESSVGKNRVTECKRHLAELNQYVKVLEHHGELTEDFLKGFQIVIFTDSHTGQLVDINNACRKNGSRFIAAESRGVFGSIFTDFGSDFEVHDVDGEEPITRIIVDLSYDDHNQITVSVHDDERHGLSDGDCVKFSDLSGSGMDAFNHCKTPLEVKSTGAYTFTVKAPNGVDLKSIGAKYERGGYVTQVKEVRKLNFKSLAESLEEPDFLDYDFAKLDFPPQLHLCFRALSQYAQQNNRLPKPYSAADAENLLAVAKQINESAKNKIDINEDIIKKFAFTCAGNINPMAAFVGGFAAQEVQKAATGKFTPIRQFLYFDALECLPDNLPTEQDAQPTGSRYDGQIAVFGQAVQNQLLSSRVFLVGSGALGCEFLKNFAMMGVGCGANGKVIVTDMDNIEISNLNRQFLFRNHHIGKSKSVTAAEQVKSMNPHFNVAALNDKVAPETESIFDDNFWDSIDIVTNALDNVEARLYTDSRCVYYKKPLLESGTLGTKGNVQVVLPHLTESYASSRDPPEKSFPSCTIKNFPSMIEHTIIWAKDYFAGSFQKNIEECNTFLGRDDYIDTLQSGKLQALQTIHENLLTARAGTLEECVVWARLKFEELFNHQIKQLLHSFPLDAKTNTGAAFWSGPKRPPTPIEFDPNDATHMQFILAAANLRAFNYGLNGERDPEKLKPIVANVMVPEFVPRNIKIQTEENKEENKKPETEDLTGDEAAIGALEKDLGGFKSSSAGYRLVPVEFDKDNDENFHIDFITATSNLRARNYKIPEADRHKTKGIAGKIIPAMVTTTALITGLVAMEFYKTLLGKKQLEAYKNSFINIAIPFITLSEPMPAPKNKYDDTEWTLWDRFEVNEGRDITLGELIDYFQNKYQLSISMMSCGSANIFSFFMQAARKQERLKMPVSEVVRTVSKKEFYPTQKYVNLEVLCENKNGDDVDTPYIRYQFRGF